jgi:hypothetical protein
MTSDRNPRRLSEQERNEDSIPEPNEVEIDVDEETWEWDGASWRRVS